MSFRETFEANKERRYIMFGGKGGLGKTTFSAATAFWLAQQGHKVLVFSVDPQASLSDIFQKDIFGKGAVKIMDNLYAQEIDADSHIKNYQNEIRKKILDMYGLAEVPEEIEHYIQAASAEPAMEESAIFDAVVDIVVGGLDQRITRIRGRLPLRRRIGNRAQPSQKPRSATPATLHPPPKRDQRSLAAASSPGA